MVNLHPVKDLAPMIREEKDLTPMTHEDFINFRNRFMT